MSNNNKTRTDGCASFVTFRRKSRVGQTAPTFSNVQDPLTDDFASTTPSFNPLSITTTWNKELGAMARRPAPSCTCGAKNNRWCPQVTSLLDGDAMAPLPLPPLDPFAPNQENRVISWYGSPCAGPSQNSRSMMSSTGGIDYRVKGYVPIAPRPLPQPPQQSAGAIYVWQLGARDVVLSNEMGLVNMSFFDFVVRSLSDRNELFTWYEVQQLFQTVIDEWKQFHGRFWKPWIESNGNERLVPAQDFEAKIYAMQLFNRYIREKKDKEKSTQQSSPVIHLRPQELTDAGTSLAERNSQNLQPTMGPPDNNATPPLPLAFPIPPAHHGVSQKVPTMGRTFRPVSVATDSNTQINSDHVEMTSTKAPSTACVEKEQAKNNNCDGRSDKTTEKADASVLAEDVIDLHCYEILDMSTSDTEQET